MNSVLTIKFKASTDVHFDYKMMINVDVKMLLVNV